MPKLVLIRHSQSQPDPQIPARQWQLTDEGRQRCEPLAAQLVPYELDVIITSTEPKAVETGELTARRLGIPCKAMENLHEHERETTPYFETREEFLAAVNNLFARPTTLVFGDETARDAQMRFKGAVESVLATYSQENIAIVTHGTVLSLWVSQLTGQSVYSFWSGLGMPAIVVFSYPTMKLLGQVNEIF